MRKHPQVRNLKLEFWITLGTVFYSFSLLVECQLQINSGFLLLSYPVAFPFALDFFPPPFSHVFFYPSRHHTASFASLPLPLHTLVIF